MSNSDALKLNDSFVKQMKEVPYSNWLGEANSSISAALRKALVLKEPVLKRNETLILNNIKFNIDFNAMVIPEKVRLDNSASGLVVIHVNKLH